MITRKAAQSKLNHNRERKKNMFKRISSLFLTLLLVVGFAFPAAADWTTYQGNNNHNGVITDGAPITASVNTAMVNLTHNGSGWDGIDTAPVMQTLDNGDTYAYVIYDGYAVSGSNGGARLAKVHANDGTEVWSKQLTTSPGFQLSTPLLVQGNDASSESDDVVYVGTGDTIQKITDLEKASPTNSVIMTGIAGQLNTPITTDGTYLYFGTWTSEGSGTYYQVEIANPTNVKTATTGDYYWAGAVVVGNYVYFGGDGGKLHYRSVANFANVGGVVDVSSAGNIRSSIAVKNNVLYFTSQNGYLWAYKTNSLTGKPTLDWNKKLAATSTSTPVITANNIIYVGYYNGFSSGGVQAIDLSTKSIKNVTPTSFKPVQSSIIAHTENNIDYLYFTTNAANGAGYGYSFDGTTGNQVWNTEDTSGKTYTLQGMAASNGYLVFGNDYNNLYIVK